MAGARPAVMEMLERCRVLGPVLDSSHVFVGVHDAVLAAERALLAMTGDDTGGRDSPGSSLLLDSSAGAPLPPSVGGVGGPLAPAMDATGVGAADVRESHTVGAASALGGQPFLIDLSETDTDLATPTGRDAPASAAITSVVSKSH